MLQVHGILTEHIQLGTTKVDGLNNLRTVINGSDYLKTIISDKRINPHIFISRK